MQQLGSMLGKGSFGRVFKGLNIRTGQFVAVKEIALTDSNVVAQELPRILVCLSLNLKHYIKSILKNNN